MKNKGESRHILFVLEHFAPMRGGLETLFLSLCLNLSRKGFRVTVITTKTDPSVPAVEKNGNLTIRRYRFFNRFAFTVLALIPVLRLGRDCSLIHTTSYNAGIPSFLGGLILRKPVVITFHEVWGKLWFSLPFLNMLQRLAFFMFERFLTCLPFHRFVAVSNSTFNQLKTAGVNPERIEVVYNGLDYPTIENHAKNSGQAPRGPKWTVTFFGRLGVSKGLELILPAFAKLMEKYPDCQLQFSVPDTPRHIRQWLEVETKRLGLQDTVSFLHPVSFAGLIGRIRKSDAILVPSWSEGFCFAAAEAIAVGTPVISSGRTALAEVVSGKHTVMSAQTAEALAEAMIAAREGNWKEIPVKRFELEQTVEGYLQVYREITS